MHLINCKFIEFISTIFASHIVIYLHSLINIRLVVTYDEEKMKRLNMSESERVSVKSYQDHFIRPSRHHTPSVILIKYNSIRNCYVIIKSISTSLSASTPKFPCQDVIKK